MLNIESDFNMDDINKYIDEQFDDYLDEVIDSLRLAGRRLVDKARAKTKDDGGFGNITWNLRSSIGMCIVDETGRIVETYFPPISKGAHGNTVGREMAERLAIYGRDLGEMCMVFVAGEEYATFVELEEAKGRDVITHVIGDNIGDAVRSILG